MAFISKSSKLGAIRQYWNVFWPDQNQGQGFSREPWGLQIHKCKTSAERISKKVKSSASIKGTFAETREIYEMELEADHTLQASSKPYRRRRIQAPLKSCPGLDAMPPAKIEHKGCLEWAAQFSTQHSGTVFNNTLGTLRAILEIAGLSHDANPAAKSKKLGVKPKGLHLPEAKQFDELRRLVATAGARQSRHCADFIRFLAFSGCRLEEARLVRWHDVYFDKMEMRVHNSKSAKTNNKPNFRFVPIIPQRNELT